MPGWIREMQRGRGRRTLWALWVVRGRMQLGLVLRHVGCAGGEVRAMYEAPRWLFDGGRFKWEMFWVRS